MLNRPILTLPVKVYAAAETQLSCAQAHDKAITPEPAIEAPVDRRVRYPLLRSLWPTSQPQAPLVAKVRHRTRTPLEARGDHEN